MAVFLQPIYTQTVGSGGAASITFNNIPQTFTDLKIVISARNNRSDFLDHLLIGFNGVTTNISNRQLYGSGTTAGSISSISRSTGVSNGASSTSNTFNNSEIYIPNYAGSNNKSYLADSVDEINSASDNGLWLTAGLWSNTAAITSISFTNNIGSSFVQYSTFSLYGILRSGV